MYIDAFLVGLTYGLTVCSWSCLPYIGPYVMGGDGGFVRGIRSAFVFSLGKLISYAALGAAAGYFGSMLSGNYRDFFQGASALVILWLGGSMLFEEQGRCGKSKHAIWFKQGGVQLLLLGVTMGLIPCLPMSGVLLYASGNNSAVNGFLLLSVFGFGTMLSPLIIIAGTMSSVSKGIKLKIPGHSLLLRRVCALILISGGVKNLIGII